MNLKSIQFRKNIALICLFLTIFAFINISVSLPVHATNMEELINKGDSEFDGTKGAAWEMGKTLFNNEIFDSVKGVLSFSSTNNTGGTSSAVKDGIWKMVQSGYDLFKTIGFLVVLLYFLIEMLERTTHDNFNLEHFFRLMIKFVLGTIFIMNGFEILTALIDFSSGIFNMMSQIQTPSGSSGSTGNYDGLLALYNTLHNSGAITGQLTAIGEIIQLIIPWLVIWGCSLYVNVIAYGRLLEIGIMGVFAPIGMADIMTEGTRGNGFRYFKRFLALGLQGAIIFGIISLFSSIQGSLYANGSGIEQNLATCIVAGALVTLIAKSQSIANALVGV